MTSPAPFRRRSCRGHGWTDAAYAALEAGFRGFDPATLQSTLVKLVASFNREATRPSDAFPAIDDAANRLADLLRDSQSKQPGFEIDYTYVDSYLLAGRTSPRFRRPFATASREIL